ncbi:MAG: cysteine desulfurase [Acidobacteriota bacterium]
MAEHVELEQTVALVRDAAEAEAATVDWQTVRNAFPLLSREVHGKPLAYLDNAATTQKPQAVLEAVERYYRTYNANVHRGVHLLSQEATEAFEESRRKVQRFIRAKESAEIIFVRGATEGINLVAQCFARPRLKPGDEILITAMEHHSNIVPWQMVCEATGAVLRVIPINRQGELLVEEVPRLLSPRTRLLAVVHVSNALGTVNPVHSLCRMAHDRGVPVLVDAAQSAPHMPLDVQALGADFVAFSGHKMYGPTGIGVLYGKRELLEEMPPYQGGGDMIASVTFERTIYNDLPHKFEAGTPHIEGAIGLGAAVDFLESIGMNAIARRENELLSYAHAQLREVPGLRIIGTATCKAAVISFVVEGIHPHDLGTILDQQGVAIRTGHHCAQPVMDFFGVPATARASLALYNTKDDIDRLVEALALAREVFQ